MKKYCTQNQGECESCSLSSYGRDCRNNPIHPKKHVAFRLSKETLSQLAELAAAAGTDRTAVIETLIDREYTSHEGNKMKKIISAQSANEAMELSGIAPDKITSCKAYNYDAACDNKNKSVCNWLIEYTV